MPNLSWEEEQLYNLEKSDMIDSVICFNKKNRLRSLELKKKYKKKEG